MCVWPYTYICVCMYTHFLNIMLFLILIFTFLTPETFLYMLFKVHIMTPSVQLSSVAQSWLLATPWTAARQASLSSPTPGAYSNSCALSWWCHPTISSSVVPFSSCPQSLPASGSFPMSQFFASGGLSIGASASASVLPMNTQDWSPLGWTGWISLQSKGLSTVFSNTIVQKHQLFCSSFLYSPMLTSLHDYGKKTIALTRRTFVDKVMSLLFNMLSSLVITLLPRSKCLLISWLQSPSAVILEPRKIKSDSLVGSKSLSLVMNSGLENNWKELDRVCLNAWTCIKIPSPPLTYIDVIVFLGVHEQSCSVNVSHCDSLLNNPEKQH